MRVALLVLGLSLSLFSNVLGVTEPRSGFVENRGQLPEDVRYYSWSPGATVYVESSRVIIDVWEPGSPPASGRVASDHTTPASALRRGYALHLILDWADQSITLEPRGRHTTLVHYLRGRDPDGWRVDVPVYDEVVYRDVRKGVDLILRASDRCLTYELVVNEGTAVATPPFQYDPAFPPAAAGGDLLWETPFGTLVHSAADMPGNTGKFEFRRVGSGQSPDSLAGQVTTDGSEPAEVADERAAGNTGIVRAVPIEFPVSPVSSGPYERVVEESWDILVERTNPGGEAPAWRAILGGGLADRAGAVALDEFGEILLVGWTRSPDFPLGFDAADESANGHKDVFALRLSSPGSEVRAGTLFGGDEDDVASALILDDAGRPIVAGETWSPNFPTTPRTFDPTYNGGGDHFLTMLSPDFAHLVYSTYLGSSDPEGPIGELARDPEGGADLAVLSPSVAAAVAARRNAGEQTTAVAHVDANGGDKASGELALLYVGPNPANPSVEIRFVAPEGSVDVQLEVFSVSGRRVRVIQAGRTEPGFHSITWDGADDRAVPVPSGVYFLRVTAGPATAAQKLVVVR